MQAREIEWEAQLSGISPDDVLAEYVRQTPLDRLELRDDVADVVTYRVRFMTGQGGSRQTPRPID